MQEEPKNKILETYSTDIVKAVKKGNVGLMQKIVHDKEGHDQEERNLSPYSKRNRFFLFVSIFLLLAALGVVAYGILAKYNKSVPVAPQFVPLVFNDKTNIIDVTGLKKADIVTQILNKKEASTVKLGGLEGLYFVNANKAVDFPGLVAMLGFHVPANYDEFIDKNFLFGLVNIEIEKMQTEEDSDSSVSEEVLPEELPIVTPAPVLVEGEVVSLDSSAFFKTGTAVFVDTEARNKAKENISTFLSGIDFSTFEIKVTGTYSVERPSEKNDDIAESRRSVGVAILNEVLNTKYKAEEIAQITIESGTDGVSIYDAHTKEEIAVMTKDEVDKLIDNTQGIQYLAQAKTKPKLVSPEIVETVAPVDILPILDDIEEVKEVFTEEVFDPLRFPKAKPSRKDVFFLLKVKSFADVFPALRIWEEKMIFDLNSVFEIDISGENSVLLTKDFEDGIIQNKNARILRDLDGDIALMYVYADDNNVILTQTEELTQEILLRLLRSKVKK